MFPPLIAQTALAPPLNWIGLVLAIVLCCIVFGVCVGVVMLGKREKHKPRLPEPEVPARAALPAPTEAGDVAAP